MAKENIEPQPKLNLDGKEYDINSLTSVQKEILADIDSYHKQINKLERWKAGQIAILKASIKEMENQENDS
tara:strand:- start:8899 stop:9111 length:213 start_codon:yes stop_codon:yes gene_type:complete